MFTTHRQLIYVQGRAIDACRSDGNRSQLGRHVTVLRSLVTWYLNVIVDVLSCSKGRFVSTAPSIVWPSISQTMAQTG